MNKQILITLVFILFTIVCIPQNSFAQSTPNEIDARTFMLSNESPGYLIDNLIAAGYGDSSLFAVMQYLQPLSGGAIPQWFMDSLALCPANSDVFTAKLFNFSDPSNNPIGIGEDGRLIVAPVYGRDCSGKEGYTTFNDTLVPVELRLFTKANEPKYYIDAGAKTLQTPSGFVTTYYKVFAIAWAQGSTFVLSNEGGLIDDLIRAGNGDKNLYQTLEILKPKSGGVISDEFMATLANCPAGSEIFTATLSNFSSEYNNPIGINSDGTLIVTQILGNHYLLMNGYNTFVDNQQAYAAQLFTYANSADKYIDAGSLVVGGVATYYKAFAIAWKASTTFVLTNEGGLIDDLIREGHGDKNLYQTLEVLKPKSDGVISDEFMAALANSPAGSEIFTVALSNFSVNWPVAINTDGSVFVAPIYGKDYFNDDGYNTNPENQKGYTSELFTYANSAENYIDAGQSGESSPTTYYKAFAIAWKASTTFVLSNEGGLIDSLIAAGYGSSNLYQTLVSLAPASNGVISEAFLETLALCPAESEIFTAHLNSYTGINNPVCINTDGTIRINDIFGKDYYGREEYATYPENIGDGRELFTYVTSPEHYIDAGSSDVGGTITYYKAFAIGWSMNTPTTFVLSNEEGGLIDQLIAEGYGNVNLYQSLASLQSASNGVISEAFMETLAMCPAGSQIFTQKLNNYANLNGAVCINTDGTLFTTTGIKGRDYYDTSGYSTYPESVTETRELFTYADSPDYYIDTVNNNTTYKVFAIGWSMNTVGISETGTSQETPSVYPNPFTDGFNIRNLPEQTRIEIFDLQGKLFYQIEPKVNSMVQPGLLPKGIYILKLTNSQGSTQQKIVKY